MGHVQTITGSGSTAGTSFVLTFPGNAGAGNFIGVSITWWKSGGGTTVSSITGCGGTFAQDKTATNGANGNMGTAIWSAADVTGGTAALTVTFGTTGVAWEASAIERDDIETTTPKDKDASASGTGTAPVSGTTATLTQADEFVMACLCVDSVSADVGIDAASGYTNRYTQQNAGATIGHSSDDKTVSATTAVDASWGTLSLSCDWIGLITTYKMVVAGPAATAFQTNSF